MGAPKLPFTVLVLAPFRAAPAGARLEIVVAERDDMDAAVAELSPNIYTPMPKALCPSGGLSLRFESMEHFHPSGMTASDPYLTNLSDAIAYIDESAGASAQSIYEGLRRFGDLPVEIAPPSKAGGAGDKVDDILSMVGGMDASGDGGVTGEPGRWTAALREKLAGAVSRALADEDFRRLEEAWRGVEFLLKRGGAASPVRVVLCPVSMDSLDEALVVLEEGLTAMPPSLVLTDLPLDSSARSMELLACLAEFGANMMAPVCAWVGPGLFRLDSWDGLKGLPYLPTYMDDPSYAKWRKLKTSPAGQWLCVSANRFYGRYPYGPENPAGGLPVEEEAGLLLAPVWGLGAVIVSRMVERGWPSDLSAREPGPLSDLPAAPLADRALSVEAEFELDRIEQMTKTGISVLAGERNRDRAFFPSVAMVSGESLSRQLVLARVVELVLWCQDNLGAAGPAQTEIELKTAIMEFFAENGGEMPEDLEVRAAERGEGEPMLVSLSLTPPASVSPGGRRIDLDLNW